MRGVQRWSILRARVRPSLMCLRVSSSESVRAPTPLRTRIVSGLIGGVAGSIGALVGLGGGVIAVPLLKLCTSLTQQEASATCLPVVFFTATVGAISYHLHGETSLVDWPGAAIIGACGMISSPLGIRLAGALPGWIVSRALGWFMLAAIPLAMMNEIGEWLRAHSSPKDETQGVAVDDKHQQSAGALESAVVVRPKHEPLTSSVEKIVLAVSLGLATGILGGAFGVGGGIVLVPVLGQVTDLQTAAATSLASIIPSAFVGSIMAVRRRIVVASVLPFLILGASGASYLAAQFAAGRLTSNHQKGCFVTTMAALGGRLVFIRR